MGVIWCLSIDLCDLNVLCGDPPITNQRPGVLNRTPGHSILAAELQRTFQLILAFSVYNMRR